MCRALFTIVFMAALFGMSSSAPAHNVPAASRVHPSAASASVASRHEHLGTDKVTRSNTVLLAEQNPASNQITASAYRDMDRIVPDTQRNPAASQPVQDDFGWRYTVALLSTLAIIGTIAARRRKAGKPWA